MRASGILLHVTSLPGRYGIGDLGPVAYAWIDKLAEAGQSWWQILPLGPTGFADSPYQCFSAFAGNPLLLSPEKLLEQGLLDPADAPAELPNTGRIDYAEIIQRKQKLCQDAYRFFRQRTPDSQNQAWRAFRDREAHWLEDYALYSAIKQQQGMTSWQEWPEDLRLRRPDALEEIRRTSVREIELCCFSQFLFFQQWRQLRSYAESRGVRILGDLPIFVALDSADAWAHPELFQFDSQRRPTVVAGVPPDFFSATGQRWGNPTYNWSYHRETGYAWWIERVRQASQLTHLSRVDHFRGFESAWEIPAGNLTAEHGQWVRGPGVEIFFKIREALGSLPLLAEDLGVITPEVDAMREQLELPGMRVLQFAYGDAQENRFLPHRYEPRTVVYTGTHDNNTTLGWFRSLSPEDRANFRRYFPESTESPVWQLIRAAWSSVAETAIAPLQDVLELDEHARMNRPGTTENNWQWRAPTDALTHEGWDQLTRLTRIYERFPKR